MRCVREHPDCYLQTHLAENHDEIATARRLYPQADELHRHLRPLRPARARARCSATASISTRRSCERLSATGSIAVFCPTSNLFIGSGLFDLAMLRDPRRPVRVGLATDVGGGTSYSMLRTAAEAYKVLQLRRQNLPALDAFYLMTLGNARALALEDRIGSAGARARGRSRRARCRAPRRPWRTAWRPIAGDLAEELFVLMTMGDDRSVRATYVAGERLHAA